MVLAVNVNTLSAHRRPSKNKKTGLEGPACRARRSLGTEEDGTFSIALCELCVAVMIFSESGNVSVANSGPIPK
jgi:hypothetical protein